METTRVRVIGKWYDEHVRDQRSREFYNSSEWRAIRQYKLNLNPLCEICSLNDVVEATDLIHHILPINTPEGWKHRLDLAFLQSLCLACHNKVEAEWDIQERGKLSELRTDIPKRCAKGVGVHH